MGETPMKFIPFSLPHISKKEISAVVSVLNSGWLSMGPKTHQFEDSFSKYVGSKYAVAVNSCTAGLFLSLVAMGVKPKDEIITTPYTFCSTANVIEHLGAKPVFVDVQHDTLNIDPLLVEKKITKKTKGIIPVHFGGHPCDMDDINKIANENNLFVIEDAAHAIGAEYKGKRIGYGKNITCFSFYATKNITTGEGGMVTTDDKKIANKIRTIRLHGMSRDAWNRYATTGSWCYDVTNAGYKFNTTDINAALGLVQLKQISKFNRRREEIAKFYFDELSCLEKELRLLRPRKYVKPAFHLFPILLKRYGRDRFIAEMKKVGVGLSVHFIPLHIMKYYREKYGYSPYDLRIAYESYIHEVSLPIYPDLKEMDLHHIVSSIKKILR